MPLAEQPRTLWDYGHSIDVLGRVIEVASGRSLYQFEKSELFDPLGMTSTKFFLTDPAERARYAQPLRSDRHVERNSLDITRWESGGGGLVSSIADMARSARCCSMAARWTARPISAGENVCRHDHRPYRARIRRRPQLLLFPRRRFWIRLRLRRAHRSRQRVPPPPGSPGEIKWDGATGAYVVVDRAQDMFFVCCKTRHRGDGMLK